MMNAMMVEQICSSQSTLELEENSSIGVLGGPNGLSERLLF